MKSIRWLGGGDEMGRYWRCGWKRSFLRDLVDSDRVNIIFYWKYGYWEIWVKFYMVMISIFPRAAVMLSIGVHQWIGCMYLIL